MADLRDLFAQVQARYVPLQESCHGDFSKISGRPAWFKPPGLIFFWNSSEFLWNVEFTLLIRNCSAVVKREIRGVVGTRMCTNHTTLGEINLNFFILFKAKMGVLLITN